VLKSLAKPRLINLLVIDLCRSAKAPFGELYHAKSMLPYWEKGKNSAVVVVCSCHDRHALEGRRAAQDLGFVSNHGLENGCVKYHKHRAEHLVYCMQGNLEVVKFGSRIGVVGCKLEVGIGLEPGIGLPSAFGYSRALADYTAFRAGGQYCSLGVLPSPGEAVGCQTDKCPLRHE